MHQIYRVGTELSDWARRLLDRPVDLLLATVNSDGSPHTAPVSYTFDGNRIWIASGSKTRKVRNIKADPRVRILVMAPAASTGIDDGWVAADGHADLVRGPEAQELNAAALGRYLTEEGQEGWAKVFLAILDVTIIITPERWQTWDESGMLNTMKEHGYTEDDVARWYVDR